jgi:hypothetical protein
VHPIFVRFKSYGAPSDSEHAMLSLGCSIWLIKQHRQIGRKNMIPDRPNNMVSVMMITFVFFLGSIMVHSRIMDDSFAEVDALVRIGFRTIE